MSLRRAAAAILLATAGLLAHADEPTPAIHGVTWLSGETAREAPEGKTAEAPLSVRLTAFLQAHWRDVDHRVVHANARRAWQMLGNGEPACQLFSVHTPERDRLAYFADVMIAPPPAVLVRRDKLAALPRNAAGEVELDRLFADRGLRGALVDGRSYGAFIDARLHDAPADANLTRYAASDFGSHVPVMLAMNRADYSIGYDLAAELDGVGKAPDVVGVPVAGATLLVRAGIACPRTPWGLAVIRRVDALFATPEGLALLHQEMDHWMAPAAQQRYAAELAAFYRERAKPAPR
ncbi:MAG: hypothetical protein JO224_10070 [Pelomonas sp.]|nr:hypothetical protein [Roseateles sp.]